MLIQQVLLYLYPKKRCENNSIHNNRNLNAIVFQFLWTNPIIDMKEPIAKKIPKKLIKHNDVRIDNYYWMKLSDEQKNSKTPDNQTQDVLDYLHAENDYLKNKMDHTNKFQEDLFTEIVGRIKQTDMSVPLKRKGYWYYSRFEEGQDYALNCRKKESLDAPEEILLNGPEMAKGHSFFAIGGRSISPNNNLMVYGVDLISRRQYTLRIKDLTTGELLPDIIENTTGGATWANDNKTIFYTRKDPITLRSSMVYKHILGEDSANDQLVYEEKDETFGCFVYKTKSEKFLMIGSYQTLSSEYRYLSADNPEGEWKIIQPRERNLEYGVSHYGDYFFITTNLDAKNFRLMKTPLTATTKENWQEVIPHRKDVLLEGIEIFNDYLVLEERKNGLSEIRIKTWDDSQDYYLTFDDAAYLAYVGANPDFDAKTLRYGYQSMTTPNSVFEYNLVTKKQKLLKQQEVMDPTFNPKNYVSERLFVPARDGVKVPISIVYRKGLNRTGNNPLLLYGYGSYGNSIDPYFSSVRLSLLNRGFVYVIAHVRGGQEMGRQWYEDGKLLKKKNTFYDFIDCGKYLIDQGFTSNEKLFAMGGSAGGLLMGAIINYNPEMWKGVVAAVPFVDVVTTMLDEDIPLTTGEYDEWGNPNEKIYYDYIKSYSPYDNVTHQNYPNLLITTGYWDSQVQYWEPAKWIAKLRSERANKNLLLMHCNMDTGHGGASGRFKAYKETALEYAFILSLVGITE